MFSYEFCEIFKNTIFTEHLRATASAYWTTAWLLVVLIYLSRGYIVQFTPHLLHITQHLYVGNTLMKLHN